MSPQLRKLLPVLLAACGLAPAATAAAQPRCDAPQVLLTVDKSSSMLGATPSGITKWNAATMAITELVTSYSEVIDFGLQVFPYPDRCAPGPVAIEVGHNSAETILNGLGDPPPSGGNWTPMAQTLDVALAYAPLMSPMRDNHLVLITDGWQWCDPYSASTRFAPVDAVTRLTDAGLTVHVVGFGGGVDSLTLNRAAVAAGTALPGCDPTLGDPAAMNHCYMQANDLADLRTVLASIARSVTDELCDGFDNDCDGTVDEGYDVDGDGYTTCGSDPTMPGTTDPGRADCNDAEATVYPGAAELCDGLDNDCDGATDTGCDCTDGATRECGSDVGACSVGTQTCTGGAWAGCDGDVGPADRETCDGEDEDCDGTVDESATCGDGMACMDGECIDTTPEVPPVEPPGEAPVQDGGCCAVAPGKPAPGDGPLAALAAMGLLGLAIARARRRR